MVSRSLGANPDDLKDPIKISIPRYVLCGQGKDEHFEFQVKVSVASSLFMRNGGLRLCSAFLCLCVCVCVCVCEKRRSSMCIFCKISVTPFLTPVCESLNCVARGEKLSHRR